MLQVGDKIRALVRHVNCEKRRTVLATRKLEKESDDIMRLSRDAWFEHAEERAAAFWHDMARPR
jgi:transcription antitermination factor NusA-like protein